MAEQETPSMRLFMIILDQPQLIDDLLTGFLDIGVPGATVVESQGMGQIARNDMPVFAGLAGLFGESTGSRVIFSVMPESLVQSVFDLVEQVVGAMDGTSTAFCVTLPVDRFEGFRS